ncbi:amino acid adenylation domain-containing protein [Actinophytocola sp.]|uniref:amino acid adenylation domain-containing protein n=1 Tax=Actinophytocola sp. TaxID=1872138 RepID=UPI002ED0CE1E
MAAEPHVGGMSMTDLANASPLTAAQQRLWFLMQADPHTVAYNLSVGLRVRGPLDVARLENALNAVIARHDSLRTVFETVRGVPCQRVLAAKPRHMSIMDADEAELDAVLRGLARVPFDITAEVVRLALVRLGAEHHVLLVSLHHLVADGWSSRLFVRDLETAYREGLVTGAPPATTLVECAAHERDARLDHEAEDFWRRHLEGAPLESRIPGSTVPRHANESAGARVPFEWPEYTSRRMKDLAASVGARPFAFLVAVVQVLVSRLAAQDDVVVAAPMANRTRPETRTVVGMFVNTVPLRAAFPEGLTFREHLRNVHEVVEDAKRHQHVPFDRILDRLGITRDEGVQPLCQVMVNLLGAPMPAPVMAGLSTEVLGQVDTGAAQYDLGLHLETPRGEGLRGWIEYRTSRYDEEWARLIVDRLHVLVESALADPDQPVALLDVLPDGERARLAAFTDVPGPEHGDKRLHDFVLEQAERRPHAPAVRDEDGELTYAELVAKARTLSAELRGHGVGPDVVVGVCGDRSVRLVVALLGVLLADGAYLPLDPHQPVRRIADILGEARPAVLLAEGARADRLRAAAPDAPILPLVGAGTGGDADGGGGTGDDLAYVIYTSGSTGRPKGVAVPHKGIVNRLVWMQSRYGLGHDDTVLQKTPATFDVSVWEFFWPLMVGATLVMARPEGHKDPEYLAGVIRRESVTTVHFVPSMLAAFVEEPALSRCDSLRRVICSGEALPSALVARFRTVNRAEVHNLYGPTEASVDVTHWTCRDDDTAPVVPIGRPVANTVLRVLDAAGGLAPIGTPGELHIGGVQLARGYLGRPDLTAERFVETADGRLYRTGDLARWTPQGYLEFLGRIDHQVKLRGLRIELGEIEAVLVEHSDVQEAVVVLREDVGPSPKLVCYVVSAADTPELRGHLAERLPEYMVPSLFVPMAAMPLTSSGKLDRKALPKPEVRRRGEPATEPLSERALVLREVWAEVLRTDAGSLSAEDNFFERGGDSLQSIRVRALLRERGLDIDVPEMFRNQRLAAMAAKTRPLVVSRENAAVLARPEVLPDDVVDAYPLSALQAGMIFHSEYERDAAVYQVTFLLHLRMPFDEKVFQDTVDALVRQHDILRTRFDLAAAEGAFQYVRGSAELPVSVRDLRGLPADEQERRASEVFDTEQCAPFDLTAPPLVRLVVLRRSDEVLDLVVSFHDSVFDGWSAATFLTELFSGYLDRLGGIEPGAGERAVRYRDFIVEEQIALAAPESERFWVDRLKGAVFLRLPRRSPAPDRPSRSIDLPVQVPTDLVARIRDLANDLGVSTKAVLLGSHVAALARATGISDVLTGLVSGGRPERVGAERVLGQFLNTAPLRVEVTGTWAQFVRSVFDAETDLFEHRRYPVVALQRKHRGRPLFETAFNYIHFHVYQEIVDRPELTYLDGRFTDPFHFPLTVNARVHPLTGELAIVANYATGELAESQALAFAHDMVDALRLMTAAPESRCEEWTCVTPDTSAAAEPVEAGSRVSGAHGPTSHEMASHDTTPLERELLDVWVSVLGMDGIDVHDDFFDLGGDSILSIQVCARARRLGHGIRPKDLFDHPTVRELSAHLEHSGGTTGGFAVTRGPVPATPQQLFVLAGDDRDWDNVSLVADLRAPLEPTVLEHAVAAVLARHESLRTALEQRQDGTCWQEVQDIADAVWTHDEPDFDTWLARLHRSLRLAEGRVFRVGQHSGRLVLVAHHAVADAASLQIVLADLLEACLGGVSRLGAGVPVAVLADAGPPSDQEVWRGLLTRGNAVAFGGSAAGTRADERVVEAALGVEATTALVDLARDTRLSPVHLLLAATGTALGGQAVTVDVMTGGRGRPELAEAVGCLAAPVPATIPADGDAVERARRVKDAVNADPRGYLALRAAEPGVGFPDVLVNYLGRFEQALPDPLVAVRADTDGDRAPRRPRSHVLEIVALIVDGSLRLRALHPEAEGTRVRAILGALVAELCAIAALDAAGSAPRAEDFPLAGLSQAGLDNLIAQLEGKAR